MPQTQEVPLSEAAQPAPDFITILKSLGKKLAKTFDGDKLIGYDDAKHYTLSTEPLRNIGDLKMVLEYLAPKPLRCAIRGSFVGIERAQDLAPPPKPGQYRRIGALFDEVPHHWAMLDIDKYFPVLFDPVTETEQAIQEFIEDKLPPEFHNASYIWQQSSSAGMSRALKAHVWVWLKTPYTGTQLAAWIKASKGTPKDMLLDDTVMQNIQCHYTASPIFINGAVDPIARGRRIGLRQGATDDVDLVIPEDILARAGEQAPGGGSDLDIKDPTQKPGVIGAFCREYPVSRVINEVLPEEFAFVDNDDARSVTWLNSDSGQPRGCWVTDDDWHFGNIHNGSPQDGRLVNAWDMVRLYKFGHLDADIPAEDRWGYEVNELPSHIAMRAWAGALPALAAGTTTCSTEDAKLILSLAGLSELEYQRGRKEAAKTIGLDLGALDKVVAGARKAIAAEAKALAAEGDDDKAVKVFEEVEPWPKTVTGADVLNEVLALLRKYVIADEATLHAAALWAALTWFVKHATVLPLAVITAPEKNCGKTILLSMLERFALRPIQASNITAAALFRTIEAWAPTLFLDEADTFTKDNEELRGVLNSGHTKDSAFVIRLEEVDGGFEPRQFSTWGAKALAGIGNLPPTIMSRAIVLKMRRKLAGESVANLRHAQADEFLPAKRRLLRWATDSGAAFAKLRPEHPALGNRDADNWEPLLALADLAGGEWPGRAILAAGTLTEGANATRGVSEELLTDVQTVLEGHEGKNILTRELLTALCNDDEAIWATYNRGHPLSPKQLANRLSAFGIKSRSVRDGFQNGKGYPKDDFKEAFARYIPQVAEA